MDALEDGYGGTSPIHFDEDSSSEEEEDSYVKEVEYLDEHSFVDEPHYENEVEAHSYEDEPHPDDAEYSNDDQSYEDEPHHEDDQAWDDHHDENHEDEEYYEDEDYHEDDDEQHPGDILDKIMPFCDFLSLLKIRCCSFDVKQSVEEELHQRSTHPLRNEKVHGRRRAKVRLLRDDWSTQYSSKERFLRSTLRAFNPCQIGVLKEEDYDSKFAESMMADQGAISMNDFVDAENVDPDNDFSLECSFHDFVVFEEVFQFADSLLQEMSLLFEAQDITTILQYLFTLAFFSTTIHCAKLNFSAQPGHDMKVIVFQFQLEEEGDKAECCLKVQSKGIRPSKSRLG